jgi:lysophospholipase L1-like esterase
MIPNARKVVIGAAGVLGAAAAALAYETMQIQKPAKGNPDEFVKRGGAPGRRVVVCLGASIVHGKVSVDFVELLRQRLPARDYAFVNAGVNGELAYEALQRIDSVIACDPDFVVILVGTNDVLATINDQVKGLQMRSKHLPCEPCIEWYGENLGQIMTRLCEQTRARVGVCSLPVLGEDLASPANRRVAEFNALVGRVAAERGAAYLPVHERQVEYLTEVGRTHGRECTGSPVPVMAAGVQHFLFGQSLDTISHCYGLALTTDMIHMNSYGAAIIADEIEKFLLAG